MPESFKPHPVVLLVDDHDGHGEQEQGQGVGHGVVRPVEEMGDGPAHHVAHGQVKQGDEEHKGPDQPGLHVLQIILHGVRGGLGPGLFPRRRGQGRPIPRLFHRGHDLVRGEGPVPVHRHGPAQQVHIDLAHPVQLPHRLVHVGGAGGAGHAGDVEFLLHLAFTSLDSSFFL